MSEWISVDERLPESKPLYEGGPEHSAHVLIVFNDGQHVSEGWREQTYKRRDWKWKTHWHPDAQVTHWMPLPEPPKP